MSLMRLHYKKIVASVLETLPLGYSHSGGRKCPVEEELVSPVLSQGGSKLVSSHVRELRIRSSPESRLEMSASCVTLSYRH